MVTVHRMLIVSNLTNYHKKLDKKIIINFASQMKKFNKF